MHARELRSAIACTLLVVLLHPNLARAEDKPINWRPSWTADDYRAAIRHPMSRAALPAVPANLDTMTYRELEKVVAGLDLCHEVPHDALVTNMRLKGFAEQLPREALETVNKAFTEDNIFVGQRGPNRAAAALDGHQAIINNLHANDAIEEMLKKHPNLPRSAAAARLGKVAERQLEKFREVKTALGYSRKGPTVWSRWGKIAQRGTKVLGPAGAALVVWNLGSAAYAGDRAEARRVVGDAVFPVLGELAADELTKAEEYTNKEYQRMVDDLSRELAIDTFGKRAVERAEGGRRIPSPDGTKQLSVSGPGLDNVSEALWKNYGQAVNRGDVRAAERILQMIKTVASGGGLDE